jgi:hypothetical protein
VSGILLLHQQAKVQTRGAATNTNDAHSALQAEESALI